MTAVTKLEAAIEMFPFLEERISEYKDDYGSFSLEYLPVNPCIFLSRNNRVGYCEIFLYHRDGTLLKKIEDYRTVEEHILENDVCMSKLVHYIVRCLPEKIQLYIPSSKYACLGVQMSIILAEERQKAKDELEKTIAGLYKKEKQPMGNSGVSNTKQPKKSNSVSAKKEVVPAYPGSEWDPITGNYLGPDCF